MKNNKRRMKYVGTSIQKKILFLVFSCAVIPATLVGLCMYYLIFHLLALEISIPEFILSSVMPVLNKVNLILAVSLPIVFIIIWLVALELSHHIAGPICRLEKELDETISGKRHGPIRLRLKDELKSITDRINKLI